MYFPCLLYGFNFSILQINIDDKKRETYFGKVTGIVKAIQPNKQYRINMRSVEMIMKIQKETRLKTNVKKKKILHIFHLACVTKVHYLDSLSIYYVVFEVMFIMIFGIFLMISQPIHQRVHHHLCHLLRTTM